MDIAVLITGTSWFNDYIGPLRQLLEQYGDVSYHSAHETIGSHDVVLILNYFRIVPKTVLSKSRFNLVIHASDLPSGKGWSPLAWQVLEGRDEIPVTLFEAAEGVDSGMIYRQETIKLDGTELIDKLRSKMVDAYLILLESFLTSYPEIEGRKQVGKESFYERRQPEDSELDPEKSLSDQFNLLRVVDNERYPAYFVRNGIKYKLTIEEME